MGDVKMLSADQVASNIKDAEVILDLAKNGISDLITANKYGDFTFIKSKVNDDQFYLTRGYVPTKITIGFLKGVDLRKLQKHINRYFESKSFEAWNENWGGAIVAAGPNMSNNSYNREIKAEQRFEIGITVEVLIFSDLNMSVQYTLEGGGL